MFKNNPILKFKGKYYPLIKTGAKTQTMRIPAKRIDNIKEHDFVVATFTDRPEMLLLEITKVGYKSFGSITDEDAKREGFMSKAELRHELETIYTEYVLQDYNRLYYYQFILAGELEVVKEQ